MRSIGCGLLAIGLIRCSETCENQERENGAIRTTSGIPLGPCSQGSAVVEALQRGRRVDGVAAGEDIGLTDQGLAVATTM